MYVISVKPDKQVMDYQHPKIVRPLATEQLDRFPFLPDIYCFQHMRCVAPSMENEAGPNINEHCACVQLLYSTYGEDGP